MTKQEKIEALKTAMTVSQWDNGDSFFHFTDNAPRELRDLYLENYDVCDIDYETFSRACDIVSEVYASEEGKDDEIIEAISEASQDSASLYTYTRLQYLDNNNEEEISETMRDGNFTSIADACAYWYSQQVENAARLIKDWVNAA